MDAKTRIAVVSPFLDKRHGTERCMSEQVERLAREYGYEVHLYSQRVEDISGVNEFTKANALPRPLQGRNDAPDPSPAAPGRIFWHKISDCPGPHLVKYLWWLLANQFRRWRDLRAQGFGYDLVYSPGINCWDADVIVAHIVFHEFYRLVRDELRLRKISLRAWPRTVHRRLYYHLIMALERRIYPDSRITLAAISGLAARQLQRFFGRNDVHVIRYGVDLDTFNPPVRQKRRVEVRRQMQFGEEDFVLLLVGNDWKGKGLACLLEAAARCRELPLQLLVVGSDARAPYLDAVARLGLDARVRFADPSADVVQFYAAADLYVGPSLQDAFALPPLEAMACGLPVIVSSQAGVSEILHDGEDGLILQDPRSSRELGEKIRQLCTEPGLCRRLGERAVETARRYGWERNAEQMRVVLEKALERRGDGRRSCVKQGCLGD